MEAGRRRPRGGGVGENRGGKEKERRKKSTGYRRREGNIYLLYYLFLEALQHLIYQPKQQSANIIHIYMQRCIYVIFKKFL